MAQGATSINDANKPRIKRKRSPSPPRPAFFVVQVLSESGEPEHFDKKRIKIISVERSAEKVLELVEGSDHPHAFYLRGIVPAGRGGPPASTASAVPPNQASAA